MIHFLTLFTLNMEHFSFTQCKQDLQYFSSIDVECQMINYNYGELLHSCFVFLWPSTILKKQQPYYFRLTIWPQLISVVQILLKIGAIFTSAISWSGESYFLPYSRMQAWYHLKLREHFLLAMKIPDSFLNCGYFLDKNFKAITKFQ